MKPNVLFLVVAFSAILLMGPQASIAAQEPPTLPTEPVPTAKPNPTPTPLQDPTARQMPDPTKPNVFQGIDIPPGYTINYDPNDLTKPITLIPNTPFPYPDVVQPPKNPATPGPPPINVPPIDAPNTPWGGTWHFQVFPEHLWTQNGLQGDVRQAQKIKKLVDAIIKTEGILAKQYKLAVSYWDAIARLPIGHPNRTRAENALSKVIAGINKLIRQIAFDYDKLMELDPEPNPTKIDWKKRIDEANSRLKNSNATPPQKPAAAG